MASVAVPSTNIGSTDHAQLLGSASASDSLHDNDVGTGYSQTHGTLPASVYAYSTATPPSNFAGCTITDVTVSYSIDSNLQRGTAYVQLYRNGSTTNSAVIGPGFANGSKSFGSTRPGGGTWSSSDFFVSTLQWAWLWNGDSDDVTKTSFLTELTMTITYTPVSAPAAAFTLSTTTGTSPLSVTFTDQGTNTPTSWLWTFGDSATSGSQNPVHVYTTPATYTVTLTETNAGGSSNKSTNSLITVLASAASVAAQFTAAPVSGVQNLSVNFFDASTGTPAPTSWAWNFGDSGTSTSQNPTHVYTTVGTYTVTLTATSTVTTATWQTDSEQKTSYITVANGKPVPVGIIETYASTVTTVNGINPFRVQFHGTATNAVPTSWSWDFGDGIGANVQNPLHVYTTISTYTPVLTVSNAIGSATDSVGPLTVNYSTATAAFTGYPVMGYGPLTVRFRDASTGDVASWCWSLGDSSTSSSKHPVHVYAVITGTTDFSLNVTETAAFANACSTTASNSDSEVKSNYICVLTPDDTYGFFFEEMKYQLMEPMWNQTVCEGFTDFGGMARVLDFTWQRLNRFVLETACLRKEATLAAATADTEDFPLPTDLIELLRVEVDGVPFYPADPYQRDRDSMLNVYIVNDALTMTVPGVFGTTPVIKVLYTYLPTAPTVPSSCTCPTEVGGGPWIAFPLPYTLWWIIRYGVMADLFTQAGLRNDPQRAGKCEGLFQDGMEIYKMLYRGNN